jgi:hypothetical protein
MKIFDKTMEGRLQAAKDEGFKAGVIEGRRQSQQESASEKTERFAAIEQLKDIQPGEPVFILRGSRRFDPLCVLQWVGSNIFEATPADLYNAFETVMEMRRFFDTQATAKKEAQA